MDKMADKPRRRKENKIQSIYSRCLITRKIVLPMTAIGKNLSQTIQQNIQTQIEGKCIVEGYIKPNSSKILTYSSGLIEHGNNIVFEIVFECEVCFPVEGMIIACTAKNITKAGIRAESSTSAKDHHYNVASFSDIKEGDNINIRVIGQRFELNDKYISIIGELIKEKEFIQKPPPRAKISFV
jgi:DNA-directed RNA polymerase subunit E'/Rpb7